MVQSLHSITKGGNMKQLAVIMVAMALTACGTVGGAVSGAGKDLSRAGDWIQSK